MKLVFPILVAAILICDGFVSYAQDCAENIFPQLNCKMEGHLRIIKRGKSYQVGTSVFLLGNASDLKNSDTVQDTTIKEVLVLYADYAYSSEQNLKPQLIGLTIDSFSDSNGTWKYKQTRQLKIVVDRNIIFDKELLPQQSFGLTRSFIYSFDLIDFRKIAEGKRTIINFEDIEIEMKPEQLKPFIELYKTTEKLNPRPTIQLCNPYRCIY